VGCSRSTRRTAAAESAADVGPSTRLSSPLATARLGSRGFARALYRAITSTEHEPATHDTPAPPLQQSAAVEHVEPTDLHASVVVLAHCPLMQNPEQHWNPCVHDPPD
jgi:hypothetical protein